MNNLKQPFAPWSEGFTLDPSCVLYLPLHSLAGSPLNSLSPGGRQYNAYGACWTPQGYVFDGTDDYIKSAIAFAIPDTGALTILVWVYWAATGSVQSLLGEGTTGNPHVHFTRREADQLRLSYHTGSDIKTISSPSDFLTGYDNRWTLVGISCKYEAVSGGYANFFRDTTLLKVNASYHPMLFPSASRYKSAGSLGVSPYNYFKGKMGEIYVANRLFGQADINAFYQATKGRYR